MTHRGTQIQICTLYKFLIARIFNTRLETGIGLAKPLRGR